MAAEKFFEGELVVAVLSLRLLVCMGALVADRLFEKISFAPRLNRVVLHPVALFGALAERTERRVNRGGAVSRFWRGAFVCVALVLLAFVAGSLAETLLSQAGWTWSFVGAVLACGVLIAHASLDRHVGLVQSALRKGHLKGHLADARTQLAHLVGRETRALSKDKVARGALESLSENCSDATVAPLFYYVVFGLGGMFAYKAINTLDSMFGYRGARFGVFGRFSARLDDVANLVPSRLTAWSLCVAALCLREFSGREALRIMRRDALSLLAWINFGARGRLTDSPNASHPEAAMAGALNIKIGGEREYRLHAEVWRAGKEIGDSERPCDWRDLVRARRLVDCAVWLLFGLATLGIASSWMVLR